MRKSIATFVLAAAIVNSRVARADEPARTRLDEGTVVSLALASHPTIDAARAGREAAKSASAAADYARIPDLTISARYSRLSSIPARFRTFGDAVFPQILDNLGVRAELSVPITDIFFTLAATARAAGHRSEAADLELTSTRAQIAYEAKVSFFTYASRTYAVANATELVHVAEGQVEEQKRKEAAGTAARNDVLPYETALDSARMGLAAARADAGAAEATLYSYVPSLRGQSFALPALDDLVRKVPLPAAAPETPVRIAALEAEKRAAESAHDATSFARLPRIAAYGIADLSAPSPRVFVLDRITAIPTWEFGIRLEWSLSQATSGSAKASEARSQAEALGAKIVAARRTLLAEREGARAALTAAEERIRLAEGRVTRAKDLARARRGELAAGTALPLAVVVAEADVLRAKNEHVDAAIERALALAKIDFVDGRADTNGTKVEK